MTAVMKLIAAILIEKIFYKRKGKSNNILLHIQIFES